jgi:hypothetical protein
MKQLASGKRMENDCFLRTLKFEMKEDGVFALLILLPMNIKKNIYKNLINHSLLQLGGKEIRVLAIHAL